MMKKVFALLLALVLCLSGMALAEETAETKVYQLGDQIEDFTVTTFDGKTITLSEVLKEKEMVLINIWATWCGPCRNEFPFMEEAYQQYKDKVEIVALSCEETDTDEVLTEFVAEMGLTFPVGRDTPDFSTSFNVTGIPTSIVVDRFGTICFIESGSQPDVGSFTRLFDAFLGEDYTESTLLYEVPPMKPNVEASAEADIAAALNIEGGALVFANSEDEYVWPMVVGEKDGRSVVASSNAAVGSSEAAVAAKVTAKAGDAVVVTFKLSSEAGCDLMQLSVNGEVVKSFAGERDWMTYAYVVEADGEYDVSVAYVKDMMADGGEDTLWVDSVAVVSGEEATAAVAANPAYPVSEVIDMTVANPDAKEILIDDVDGQLASYFGDGKYYIIPGETADFVATLTADADPEIAFGYCNYDGSTIALVDCMTADGYAISGGIDSMETSGYSYTNMYLYAYGGSQDPVVTVTYFASEENANAFVNEVFGEGVSSWTYADGTLPSTDALPGEAADVAGVADYVLTFADQDGNPVAGVMAQVCDDETCMVYTSDENGVCEFSLAPYVYEIHILKAPEGYTADTETITVAPEEGGELAFTVTKD